VDPVGPVIPTAPVEPVAPVGPVTPADPVDPVEPVGPVCPIAPEAPESRWTCYSNHPSTSWDPVDLFPTAQLIPEPVGPVTPVDPVVQLALQHQLHLSYLLGPLFQLIQYSDPVGPVI
jgi:hypothetical protein